MPIKTLELLESLMSGDEMTPEMLDELLATKTPEDLYLDYKHGDLLSNEKKAASVVREYVSAFANSSGGVLLIGINDAWSVTGCLAPGGGKLTEWAARVLTSIGVYLSPQPRIYQVDHPNGKVLVIATARTPGLVSVVESSILVHYFRLHDQTLKAPGYLVSDIVLGRRQRPELYITSFGLHNIKETGDRSKSVSIEIAFETVLHVENSSLYWADGLQVGIISFARESDPFTMKAPIGVQLRSFIDVRQIEPIYSGSYQLIHCMVGKGTELTPFGVGIRGLSILSIPWRYKGSFLAYIWKAAIYIIAKNAEPVWYQVGLKLDWDLVNRVMPTTKSITIDTYPDYLTLERKSGERPIVTWEMLTP